MCRGCLARLMECSLAAQVRENQRIALHSDAAGSAKCVSYAMTRRSGFRVIGLSGIQFG